MGSSDLLGTARDNFGNRVHHTQHNLYQHAVHHYHHNSTLKATLFSIIGVLIFLSLISKLFRLWRNFKLYVLARPLQLGKILDKYGKWAVVTGASDGIGKEYALQLAARGLNVALVARNQTKLDAVAQQIKRENPARQTATFVIDFARATRLDYRRLEEELSTLPGGGDVGVLVNNVGLGFDLLAPFHEYPDGEQLMLDMISTNMTPTALMCKMILPQMVKKQKGVIINISSVAAHVPPNGTWLIYPQTKRFLCALSEGLADEYGSDGIIVQSVCPGLVRTNMSAKLVEQSGEGMASLLAVDAKSYVEWALSQVGLARETFGHPRHAITTWVSLMLPNWMYKKLTSKQVFRGEKLQAFLKKQ